MPNGCGNPKLDSPALFIRLYPPAGSIWYNRRRDFLRLSQHKSASHRISLESPNVPSRTFTRSAQCSLGGYPSLYPGHRIYRNRPGFYVGAYAGGQPHCLALSPIARRRVGFSGRVPGQCGFFCIDRFRQASGGRSGDQRQSPAGCAFRLCNRYSPPPAYWPPHPRLGYSYCR